MCSKCSHAFKIICFIYIYIYIILNAYEFNLKIKRISSRSMKESFVLRSSAHLKYGSLLSTSTAHPIENPKKKIKNQKEKEMEIKQERDKVVN